MPQTILYFDLETQKSAQEVGGWANKKEMRVSLAVTYSTRDQTFQTYREPEIPALLSAFSAADGVIGFNVVRFDYPVLSGYSDFDFSKIPTFDLLADLYARLGFRVSLDNLAQATLQAKKSADGLAALQWFKEGNFAKIEEYCKQDVAITRDLHQFGCRETCVYYTDRDGLRKKVAVTWSDEVRR